MPLWCFHLSIFEGSQRKHRAFIRSLQSIEWHHCHHLGVSEVENQWGAMEADIWDDDEIFTECEARIHWKTKEKQQLSGLTKQSFYCDYNRTNCSWHKSRGEKMLTKTHSLFWNSLDKVKTKSILTYQTNIQYKLVMARILN